MKFSFKDSLIWMSRGAFPLYMMMMLLAGSVVLNAEMAFSAREVAPKSPAALSARPQSAPSKKAPSAAKKPEEKKLSKEETAKEIAASIASAAKVDPLELLQKPGAHLNKKVTFNATFNRFADTGLDYKKAFRDSRDYVSFFILRPDVGEKTIPLSEMKLFFPRKKSDEVMDIESGDKIQLVGTVFSTALDEPWVDVDHIKIVQKTARPERKHTPEF